MFVVTEDELQRWNRAVISVIRGSRGDADMSQQELADRLHVSRNTVANMETGRRAIRVAELPLIAKALGCHPEAMFRRVLSWFMTSR
jgi:transcriptional regulator with XRE-family HTH domain